MRPPPDELRLCPGQVKWFDATRGFGFVVDDQVDGRHPDPFLGAQGAWPAQPARRREHHRHRRKQERGYQARSITTIDLSTALPIVPRPAQGERSRSDRSALAEEAGEYEPVEVKWFNRVKGYGFLVAPGRPRPSRRIFSSTWRRCARRRFVDLEPEQRLEARIAAGKKGLTAVELRRR